MKCNFSWGGTPLIYYFGLFGDICVPIYCFTAGYAQIILQRKSSSQKEYIHGNLRRLVHLAVNCWVILTLYLLVRAALGQTLNFKEVALNALFLRNSYNGAWWFIFTYGVLTLAAPLLKKMIDKHGTFTAILMAVFYVTGFWVKFKFTLPQDNVILQRLLYQYGNLAFSVPAYWVGMLFAKNAIYGRITKIFDKLSSVALQRMVLGIAMAAMLVGHGIVQTVAVSPVTGIITLCIFHLWMRTCKDTGCISRSFLFFGKHSTNVWLVHMFVMDFLLRDGMFVGKYPLVILGLVLGLSVGVSYVIGFIIYAIGNMKR